MAGDPRVVRFHALGGPEVLALEAAAPRDPEEGEVAIRVHAIGVTQGDAMYRRGTYLEKPDLPSGLGTESCGVVEAVGPGVTAFRPGDRVSSMSTFSINRYPLYADRAVLPQTALVRTPEGFSDVEGAAYTLAFFPMYFALVREARVKAGDWVLLTAAGATTALAAAQIAHLAGARTIGVVRSAAKAAALAGEAYDHVLVDDDALEARVRGLTAGRGVDIALDPVLGPGAARLSAMAAPRGRILHYGALASPDATHSIYTLAPKFLTVQGFTIYGYSGSTLMGIPRDARAMAEAEAFIAYGVERGALRPRIAAAFPLEQVVKAHAALEAGTHVGKLVLLPEGG